MILKQRFFFIRYTEFDHQKILRPITRYVQNAVVHCRRIFHKLRKIWNLLEMIFFLLK